VAYADRTSSDGREYVAVLLPEAVELPAYGPYDPYASPSNANTRIAVVDATARMVLWTYEYPRGGTTPVLGYHVNSSTKQIIAGDALYVAYVKTATNLDNYVSSNLFSALSLYVDRFVLANGTKTSFVFPMGVQANTLQLDDLAAADGMFYALVTYREWPFGGALKGGAQALVALGAATPGNVAPVFTAGPVASPPAITLPANTCTLTAAGSDSDGPAPAIVWSRETGAGRISFSTNNASVASTVTATFTYPGTNVISCRLTDGDNWVSSNVTVVVNPPLTVVSVLATDNTATETNQTTGTFSIRREGGDTNVAMTIYFTITGTASNGVDYVALGTNVVMNPGITNMTLTVIPIDDSVNEADETVILNLGDDPAFNYRVSASSASMATVTLADNDSTQWNVWVTAPDVSATEGNASDPATFSIIRNGSIDVLTVKYALGGTASNGVDFVQLTGSVTLAHGKTNAVVQVLATNDAVFDPDETVILTLSDSPGYTIVAPSNAVASIVDRTSTLRVWNRDQEEAPWCSNHWDDAISAANIPPRDCDVGRIGMAMIDIRPEGLNMPVAQADVLEVGWRADEANGDDGQLSVLGYDGYNACLQVNELRLANGVGCSGSVTQYPGLVEVYGDLKFSSGAGFGGSGYTMVSPDARLLVGGDLCMGDLGADKTDFDSTNGGAGCLDVQGGQLSVLNLLVNAGGPGATRTVLVGPDAMLEFQDLQVGGAFCMMINGYVSCSSMVLGKSAAGSNSVITLAGGFISVAGLLDMNQAGVGQVNITGGIMMLGSAPDIREAPGNRVLISGAGEMWVAAGAYSTNDALVHIAAGCIAGEGLLAVTTTNSNEEVFTRIAVTEGITDSNGNGIPDAWEQQVFGNLTNSATGDNDGDGLDNFGEWVAGTHPTNGRSVFRFTNLVQNAGSGRVLSWYSESNRFYTLKLSTNLILDPFSSMLTNRMPANPPVNVYTDVVERSGASFYRVTVTNQ
jgi:hypothetical protein